MGVYFILCVKYTFKAFFLIFLCVFYIAQPRACSTARFQLP